MWCLIIRIPSIIFLWLKWSWNNYGKQILHVRTIEVSNKLQTFWYHKALCRKLTLHAGYLFMLLLSSADFFKINFFNINFFQKIISMNTIRVSNGLDPEQDRQKCWSLLGSKLFTKVISRRQMTPLAWKEFKNMAIMPSFFLSFTVHRKKNARFTWRCWINLRPGKI